MSIPAGHPASIRSSGRAALEDARLQRALSRGVSTSLESRARAVAEVENWEALREYARQVKDHTLDNLGSYLSQLEERLRSLGVEVLWASTPDEAVEAILEVARRHGVTSVVKSKTMIGEEIALNAGLEKAGLTVTESDLGEYIVQLAGETPSHIIAPALHKSQEDVAELFSRELGTRADADADDLTAVARSRLRSRFLEAGMGLSGVNFAVAEDGTLVVVENEGNARLAVGLPPVHVALMSLEKVIPRRRDLSVFLKLLVRSATGQRATSYVNLIRGPCREGETDGPRHQYVVILDNGRSRIASDGSLREVLRCVRCGACQNVCPVFQRIGGHAYGTVYQGPIGALLSPQLGTDPLPVEHPFVSSLCGACSEVCPVKIDIPHLLLELRRRATTAEGSGSVASPMARLAWRAWAAGVASPYLLERVGAAARWLGRRVPAVLLAVPSPLQSWHRQRELPPMPTRSFRSQYRRGRR